MLLWCNMLSAQPPLKPKNPRKSSRWQLGAKTFPQTNVILFQYGIASAFIQGVYNGQLSMGELKKQGNFGLGAPNLVDGELTVLDGKVFQTNSNGDTFEAVDSLKTPFIFVTSFQAGFTLHFVQIAHVEDLFARVEKYLPNKNNLYAIRITGEFSKMNTRAFSPVYQSPYKPLSQLLDQQHFFNYDKIRGTMVGFYIPGYLSGLNIAGMHFHFLSSDFKKGGHVLDLSSAKLKVEFMEINCFQLTVPQSLDFKTYSFKQANSRDLNIIENRKN